MNKTCLHPNVFFLCILYTLPSVYFSEFMFLYSFFSCFLLLLFASRYTVARESKIFLFSVQYMQCLQVQRCYLKPCFKFKATKSYAPNLLIRSSINGFEDTLNKSGTVCNKGFICDFDSD